MSRASLPRNVANSKAGAFLFNNMARLFLLTVFLFGTIFASNLQIIPVFTTPDVSLPHSFVTWSTCYRTSVSRGVISAYSLNADPNLAGEYLASAELDSLEMLSLKTSANSKILVKSEHETTRIEPRQQAVLPAKAGDFIVLFTSRAPETIDFCMNVVFKVHSLNPKVAPEGLLQFIMSIPIKGCEAVSMMMTSVTFTTTDSLSIKYVTPTLLADTYSFEKAEELLLALRM